jgi:hypothetical protein
MSNTKNILKYQTEQLPLHFIMLGYMLLALGVWRIVVADWKGILYLIFSLVFIFFSSGIVINAETRQLKQYNGFFLIKWGKGMDISQALSLELVCSTETQRYSMLTLSKTESLEVFKLYMNMPDNDILLMAGKSDKIIERANEISNALQISLINKSDIL